MNKEIVMLAVPAVLLVALAIGVFIPDRWLPHFLKVMLSLSLLYLAAVVVFA